MAPSTKHFPFLLFFFALLSSLPSHARESYFFNKATTTNNNAKETAVAEEAMPNKSNDQEQEPNFIPDTQSGYGLYGQNSNGNPTTTDHPSDSFEPYTAATSNNNNNYYKNDPYVSDPQGMMSDTRLMDGRHTTTKTTSGPPYTAANRPYETESGESYYPTATMNNNNNNNNYYNKEAYVSDPHEGMSHDTRFTNGGAAASNNNYYYNGGGRNYNTQQQGMSDTRFLENGRYYYDINSEENYQNRHQNSRRVNNNRGYYGNYKEDSYENDESIEGHQSQNGQFQGSEADQYVP